MKRGTAQKNTVNNEPATFRKVKFKPRRKRRELGESGQIFQAEATARVARAVGEGSVY